MIIASPAPVAVYIPSADLTMGGGFGICGTSVGAFLNDSLEARLYQAVIRRVVRHAKSFWIEMFTRHNHIHEFWQKALSRLRQVRVKRKLEDRRRLRLTSQLAVIYLI